MFNKFLSITLFLLLATQLIPFFRRIGIYSDPFFVAAYGCGAFYGMGWGVVGGCVWGWVADVLSGQMGWSVWIFGLTGFAAGFLTKNMIEEGLELHLLGIGIFSMVKTIGEAALLAQFTELLHLPPGETLFLLMATAIGHIALAPLMTWLFQEGGWIEKKTLESVVPRPPMIMSILK